MKSSHHTLACIAVFTLAAASAGCGKKADGTGPAASGTAAGTTTPTSAKPKATLKLADVKAAYKSELDNMAKMKDPMDKKVDAFVAKVGKPAADTGRKKTWYALDGDKCSKVDIDTKDGSITDQTTDKADCGM